MHMLMMPRLGQTMTKGKLVEWLIDVGQPYQEGTPVYTIETNVKLTEIALDLASKKKRPILLTSTSEVYGKSTDFPFREDSDLVMGPTHKHRWAYACSKAIDEFLALAYHRERADSRGPVPEASLAASWSPPCAEQGRWSSGSDLGPMQVSTSRSISLNAT